MKIKCDNICFSYDKTRVIESLDLDIKSGKLVTIVGPSGCGKTTLLKLLAGLISVDSGAIYFGEKDVTGFSPQKRDAAMVFQSYALFPHMTVIENVTYGLKNKKMSKKERLRSGRNILDKVGLSSLEDRSVQSLSGGQQQRVALARSMVIKPAALLLDEPLSNLDKILRVEMRREIKALQKDSGITTIYVTHDQEEAMAISDEIIVMNQGKILQIGSPEEIYAHPATPFVASFMGIANSMKWENTDIFFRPESVKINANGKYCGKLLWKEYLGNIIRYGLQINEQEIIIEQSSVNESSLKLGQEIRFDI